VTVRLGGSVCLGPSFPAAQWRLRLATALSSSDRHGPRCSVDEAVRRVRAPHERNASAGAAWNASVEIRRRGRIPGRPQEPVGGSDAPDDARVALALDTVMLSLGGTVEGPPVAKRGTPAPNVVGMEIELAMSEVTRIGLIVVVFQPRVPVESLAVLEQQPRPVRLLSASVRWRSGSTSSRSASLPRALVGCIPEHLSTRRCCLSLPLGFCRSPCGRRDD
jgi:hypothetical protein